MNNPNMEKGYPPPAPAMQPNPYAPWTVGVCDCFSDCGRFCMSFWCPCITFGQVAEIIDGGSSSCSTMGALYTMVLCVSGMGFIFSCIYRSKMRKQYMLQGSGCGDCIKHWCCEPCSLTQMYRELQSKGFDPSIGWKGNVQRQMPGVAMAYMVPPPMQGGMKR